MIDGRCAARSIERQCPGRRWIVPLVLVGLVAGCSIPTEVVLHVPYAVWMRPGQNAVAIVWSLDSETDYDVRGLPGGLTYDVDDSLRGPSTSSVSRISFHADTAAEPGRYEVLVRALRPEGTVGEATLPIYVLSFDEPVSAAIPVAAAAGGTQTAVALADGTLWARGGNADAELGVGDRRARSAPVRVDVAANIAAVAAQAGFNEIATAAAGTDGTLWIWGGSRCADDADAGTPSRDAPVLVSGLPLMQAVALGFGGALGLAEDGTVWVWGGCRGDVDARGPAQVDGLSDVVGVAAGSHHALALAADGTVWSWGMNDYGQLGSGDAVAREQPAPVADLADVVDIAASGVLSLALVADGTVWAWGDVVSGLLDDGVLQTQSTPVQVAGLNGVEAIAAGGRFAYALTNEGKVREWVGRFSGLLGAGDTDPDKALPVELADLDDVTQLSAGLSHALAITGCGQLWGWGDNSYRRLRNTDVEAYETPVLLADFADDGSCDRVALRISLAGKGSVQTQTGPSLDCGDTRCIGVYGRGTTVTLAAEPYLPSVDQDDGGEQDPLDAATLFVGWEGDCQGTNAEISVAMTATTRCTAVFRSTLPELYLLTVDQGVGGSVASSGGGVLVLGPDRIDCGETCDAIFAEGTEVTLTAVANPDLELARWSGDCAGTDPRTTVTMNGRKTCVAEFASTLPPPPPPLPQLTLQVGTSGIGTGTVTAPGIDCPDDCNAAYDEGTQVTLTATPEPGSSFVGWSQASDADCAAGPATITVSMTVEDKLCIAVFDDVPSDRFTIRVSIPDLGGSPNDSVQSFPAGIDCAAGASGNAGTCEAQFTDEQVRLFASPADGDAFDVWSPNCIVEEPVQCLIENPKNGSTIEVAAAFFGN